MPITANDFVYVYSGGSDNADQTASLGGEPSAVPIIGGTLNNLYPDVTGAEVASGYTDYRCFYAFNDSADSTLYNAKVMIQSQVVEGATATIGFLLQDDYQSLTVVGNPVGGTLVLHYETYSATITFDADPDRFATNIQSALNALGNLTDVVCEGSNDNGAITVLVKFSGADGNRYQPLMTATNNIVGATAITVTKVQDGSPINAIVPAISDATVRPPGVNFGPYTPDAPFLAGNLYAGDGLPVWVGRSTPQGTTGARNDGFNFRITGSPIPIANPPPTFYAVGTGGITMSGEPVEAFHYSGYYTYQGGGEVDVGGSADADFLDADGKSHRYYTPTGGIQTGGAATAKESIRLAYVATGGATMGGEPIEVTTGLSYVNQNGYLCCGFWPCDSFPVQWFARFFLIKPGPSTLCQSGLVEAEGYPSNLQFFQGTEFQNNTQTTTQWNTFYDLRLDVSNSSYRAPVHCYTAEENGTGNFCFCELFFYTTQNIWIFRIHGVQIANYHLGVLGCGYTYNSDNGVISGDCSDNPTSCVYFEMTWAADQWNCCGVNNVLNSTNPNSEVGAWLVNFELRPSDEYAYGMVPYVSYGPALCDDGHGGFALCPSIYSVPNPGSCGGYPCQAQAGPCCREKLMATNYVFGTYFGSASPCYPSRYHGQFRLALVADNLDFYGEPGGRTGTDCCMWQGLLASGVISAVDPHTDQVILVDEYWRMLFMPSTNAANPGTFDYAPAYFSIYSGYYDPSGFDPNFFTPTGFEYRVSAADFACCGITSPWTLQPINYLNEGHDCSTDPGTVGLTYPTGDNTCGFSM